MNAPEKRLSTHALIPWVCALVAIFGCNALGVHSLSLRKIKCFDGSSLTQVTPESPTTGNVPAPPVFLTPDPADGMMSRDPSSRLLAIASRIDLPAASARRGETQGRAPPVEVC